jgi:hypothetical protein
MRANQLNAGYGRFGQNQFQARRENERAGSDRISERKKLLDDL